jgi:hypothetical protein
MTLAEPVTASTGHLPNAKPKLTGLRRRASVHARALPLTLALSGFLWLNPYWFWGSPTYFRFSVVLVTLVFLATFGAVRTSVSSRNILLALFLLGLFLYFGSHRSSGLFAVSTGWLVLVVFILADDEVKHHAFHYFSSAFALSLVPGIIAIALLALGIDLPWHTLPTERANYDILIGTEPTYYRQYLGSVMLNTQIFPVARGWIGRLHGMYEEPGVVGTFAALLLAADGGRLRRSAQNVILLIGGLLSFSLGFYVIMFLYLLLRRPLHTVAASGGIIAVLVSSSTFRDAPIVQAFFLNRLAFSGGRFLGDTRVTGLFAAMYHDFWNADLSTRLFGSPQDVSLLVNTGTFSYKLIFFSYGVAGAAALFAFLAISTMSVSRGKAALTLLIVFLISIYQRPNVLMLPYLLVLLGGAVHLRRADDSTAVSSTGDGAMRVES